jgi:hypothetical protein
MNLKIRYFVVVILAGVLACSSAFAEMLISGQTYPFKSTAIVCFGLDAAHALAKKGLSGTAANPAPCQIYPAGTEFVVRRKVPGLSMPVKVIRPLRDGPDKCPHPTKPDEYFYCRTSIETYNFLEGHIRHPNGTIERNVYIRAHESFTVSLP